MARDFLAPAARAAIANLQRGVHAGGMLVSINPERMLVQIDRNLGQNTEALSWAVQKALVLHDGLIEGVSRRVTQGIAIVDQPGAPDEDDGPPICKVCGEPIAARRGHRLLRLQYASSPRLLGVCGRLFDLWLQRQGRCGGITPFHSTTAEAAMSFIQKMPTLVLAGLLLAVLSFAPAPPADQTRIASLAEARLQAALKQYEETWAYYQQARIDSYQVYVWSKLILDCRREMAEKPAERLAALEDHLSRMKKLEALIKKVRRLGFGRSYDVGASEYYRLEAELWLARTKAGK